MNTSVTVSALSYPLEAELMLPGSKSHANRAIVCACLAEGETVIRNATPCDDVLVMVDGLRKMGFEISWIDRERGELKIVGGTLTLSPSPEGGGERRQGLLPPSGEGSRMGVVLDCHNAGTALRFLTSVAALMPGIWTLTGNEHMQKRPIGDLIAALRSLGAEIGNENGCPPLMILGGVLTGNRVTLKASISSQYLTSLLLIAPMLPEGLEIELEGALASESYISLTEKVLSDFGIQITRKLNTFIVQKKSYVLTARPSWPRRALEGRAEAIKNMNQAALLRGSGDSVYSIEGDWSAAGSWLILNELTKSRLSFPNLREDSSQADRKLPDMILKLRKSGDIVVDCSGIPDQVMNLAVLAAFREGKTTITGAANLRHKECDRLQVIVSELTKAGIAIQEHADGIIVFGKTRNKKMTAPVVLNPHGDHRMAMCFAILGLRIGGIVIQNPECVVKSYPQFFKHLETARRSSRPIAIVGMRGAGKSSFAKKLASRLKLRCADSDRVFESTNGLIKKFIQEKGWPAFRKHEEDIIDEYLIPGTVLSLGGGGTESKKTRQLLKSKAIVFWIQATKEELLKRLESGKRPSITDLPHHEEVHKLLVERAPNYKEVSTIMIPPTLPYSKQIPYALKALRAFMHSEKLS